VCVPDNKSQRDTNAYQVGFSLGQGQSQRRQHAKQSTRPQLQYCLVLSRTPCPRYHRRPSWGLPGTRPIPKTTTHKIIHGPQAPISAPFSLAHTTRVWASQSAGNCRRSPSRSTKRPQPGVGACSHLRLRLVLMHPSRVMCGEAS
jgi:hypothetical protein